MILFRRLGDWLCNWVYGDCIPPSSIAKEYMEEFRMSENSRFSVRSYDGINCHIYDRSIVIAEVDRQDINNLCNLLNDLSDENNQLIKGNFELQGLLGDVRALLRLDKVDDAINRIDKFERSMKK